MFSENRHSSPDLSQVVSDVYHTSPSSFKVKTEWSYVGRAKVLLLHSNRRAVVFLRLGHSS